MYSSLETEVTIFETLGRGNILYIWITVDLFLKFCAIRIYVFKLSILTFDKWCININSGYKMSVIY